MEKQVVTTLLALTLGAALAIPATFADTPKTLKSAQGTSENHQHGVNVTGKIKMFRAQETGLELGPEGDKIDAEILVTLDTEPDKVFGIRLHEDNPANREMIETLRQAYMNDKPITLQHRLSPGKKNLRVTWVQLGETQ